MADGGHFEKKWLTKKKILSAISYEPSVGSHSNVMALLVFLMI